MGPVYCNGKGNSVRSRICPLVALNITILSNLSDFLSSLFAAQAKQKTDEASRSEAKFLKMKAWSKSRIRQLEEELKKSQVR